MQKIRQKRVGKVTNDVIQLFKVSYFIIKIALREVIGPKNWHVMTWYANKWAEMSPKSECVHIT